MSYKLQDYLKEEKGLNYATVEVYDPYRKWEFHLTVNEPDEEYKSDAYNYAPDFSLEDLGDIDVHDLHSMNIHDGAHGCKNIYLKIARNKIVEHSESKAAQIMLDKINSDIAKCYEQLKIDSEKLIHFNISIGPIIYTILGILFILNPIIALSTFGNNLVNVFGIPLVWFTLCVLVVIFGLYWAIQCNQHKKRKLKSAVEYYGNILNIKE